MNHLVKVKMSQLMQTDYAQYTFRKLFYCENKIKLLDERILKAPSMLWCHFYSTMSHVVVCPIGPFVECGIKGRVGLNLHSYGVCPSFFHLVRLYSTCSGSATNAG